MFHRLAIYDLLNSVSGTVNSDGSGNSKEVKETGDRFCVINDFVDATPLRS